jgi:protein-S-isoprenylcysteine O-methyltransferase Ste14
LESIIRKDVGGTASIPNHLELLQIVLPNLLIYLRLVPESPILPIISIDKERGMDGWIVIGLGALFLVLGILAFIWGCREMDNYYMVISQRRDVREFIERSPLRPEPEALKIGGVIAVVVGVVLVVLGIIWL